MGINSIQQLLTGSVVSTVLASVFSLFSFGLLFYYDPGLAVIATALTAVTFTVMLLSGYSQLRNQRILTRVQARIAGLLLQLLTGIAKLRVSGSEVRAFARWADQFTVQKEVAFQAQTTANRLATFNAAWPIVTAMALFAGVAFWRGESLSTGAFLAFSAAFGQFLGSVLAVSSIFSSLSRAIPLYEMAEPILKTRPEVDTAKTEPGPLSGGIEVSHVRFRYQPDDPLVLNDVSLSAKPGQFIAIVGPSGAGKSTLVRLLLGFEEPEAGTIYYDGQNLATVDVEAVRRQMGVVTQDGQLMPGDIYMNIVGGSLLTMDDAWEAARLAGIEEEIREMPMGMHTYISEGGSTFSGGQRQRLLIARAVAPRPRILIFDEATSALDNRTQALVSQSLESLRATRIVIAHRLSTIMKADRIDVLVDGRIVQSGTYDALMSQEGPFRELAARQLA
jgi:NHLM bacteriocin system ABC transporter ATP-binding protein